MAEFLASLGASVGESVASTWWISEESDCPESLLK